jgi:VanZ family protein
VSRRDLRFPLEHAGRRSPPSLNIRMNAWSWAVIGWIGLIFFSSTSIAGIWSERAFKYLVSLLLRHLRPDSPSYGLLHYLAHKSVHLTLFFVLAILLWKALSNPRRKIVVILLIGAIVGSCSEFLQRFFPGRDPAILDVLINIGATALGVGASLAFSKLQVKHSAVYIE